MNLDDALEQLDLIHAHLARAETYHGYRPYALAGSGIAGLTAALAQPWFVAPTDAPGFTYYWLWVAVGCAVLAVGATILGYFTREDEFEQRRTRTVLGQFVPCLLVGGILTHVFLRVPDAVVYLPAAWGLVYALGVIASQPYLPRSISYVAIWYLSWGLLLTLVVEGPVPAGWTVGVPFGFGQMFSGFVCYRARKEMPS